MDDNEEDDDVAEGVEIEEESEMEEDSDDSDGEDIPSRNVLNEREQAFAQFPSALQPSHNLKPPSVVPLNPPTLSPPRGSTQPFGYATSGQYSTSKKIASLPMRGKVHRGGSRLGSLTRTADGQNNLVRTALPHGLHPFVRPVGAALRVMPPKKRVKLNDDDEANELGKVQSSIRAVVTTHAATVTRTSAVISLKSTANNLHATKSKRPPILNDVKQCVSSKKVMARERLREELLCSPKNKPTSKIHKGHQRVSRFQLHVGKNKTVCILNDTIPELVTPTEPAFLDVQFKRPKKLSSERKCQQGKLDLITPESVIATCNIKDILTRDAFNLIPPAYQYQLLMLLPKVDRQQQSDYMMALAQQALSNEFFSTACNDYKEKLLDGEFNSDVISRIKQDTNQTIKLDTWKTRFFEPVYGMSSSDELTGGAISTMRQTSSSKVLPLESSWRTFLEFSENKSVRFVEALERIKERVKQEEVSTKAASKSDLLFNECEPVSVAKSRGGVQRIVSANRRARNLPQKSSALRLNGSPQGMKGGKPEHGGAACKEKNRWVVKRAQLLRKKAVEKQLKEAKAKMFEDLRKQTTVCDEYRDKLGGMSVLVEQQFETTAVSGVIVSSLDNSKSELHKNTNTSVDVTSATGAIAMSNKCNSLESGTRQLEIVASESVDQPHNNLKKLSENVQRLKNEERLRNEQSNCRVQPRTSSSINLSDALSLKDLIRGSNPLRSTAAARLKPSATAVKKSGRVGVTGGGGKPSPLDCGCQMRPMRECKRCLSIWHIECMATDMLCLICSTS